MSEAMLEALETLRKLNIPMLIEPAEGVDREERCSYCSGTVFDKLMLKGIVNFYPGIPFVLCLKCMYGLIESDEHERMKFASAALHHIVWPHCIAGNA
jgi:hypothetical protein